MKIMLVNPPSALDEVLGAGEEFVQCYEPLGLLYIAAVLCERGHEVSVVDAQALRLSSEDVYDRVCAEVPDIVGFSVLTCNGALVFELGKRLYNDLPETFVVLGNVHASVYSREYLKANACSVVIHGEGEYVFCDLADGIDGIKDLSDVNGISYLDSNGKYCRNGENQIVVDDINKLPFPARDLVESKLYRLTGISNQMYIPRRGEIARTMVTSRGCPNRCTFCVVHSSRKPRYNSARRVVDEMEMLEKNIKHPTFI